MFGAFIFDLDGTLVDSSQVVFRVMEKWCRKHGLDVDYAISIGRGARVVDTVSMIAPHLDAREEAAKIEFEESVTLEGLKSIGGANEFIQNLNDSKWAIVTSGTLSIARPRLKECNFVEPKVFITAENVTNGKPHPEPFLIAAKNLELNPQDCLVFEDADNGVNSALKAGCKVVVIGAHCSVTHPNILFKVEDYNGLKISFSGGLSVEKVVE